MVKINRKPCLLVLFNQVFFYTTGNYHRCFKHCLFKKEKGPQKNVIGLYFFLDFRLCWLWRRNFTDHIPQAFRNVHLRMLFGMQCYRVTIIMTIFCQLELKHNTLNVKLFGAGLDSAFVCLMSKIHVCDGFMWNGYYISKQ